MKMPDRPDTWGALLDWLREQSLPLYAAALAFAMAVLRILYGGGTRQQMLVEGALCGGLTLTLCSALEWLNIPISMSTFVGGWVGFLGVEKIREIAGRFFDIKLPRK
ncbi:phage holin, lambda family [Metapseudomonas otitidis]|uniref:phage holin, lambda family n=1 Tax=Pseudomonas TaxID=286 RepID=UPI001610BE2C|nr:MULTISPECIES: phage holin, lambda family [Pseudomonas]MBB4820950.1 lambda family phage holin [Pseudomonas alcaligenes]WCD82982.1 phage holin, lambda family [Pseudomonas sp. TUM22785]BBP82868.1 holin [Pseudomonas sp. Pc102]